MNHPTNRKERVATPEEWAREAKALDAALFARRGYRTFGSIGLDVIGLDDGTDLLRPGSRITTRDVVAAPVTKPVPLARSVPAATPAKPVPAVTPKPPPPAPVGTATAAFLAGKTATAKTLAAYLESQAKESSK